MIRRQGWHTKLWCMALSLGVATSVYAHEPARIADYRNWRPVLSVAGAGLFSTNIGASAVFPIVSPSSDAFDYQAKHSKHWLVAAQGFLGAEYQLKPYLAWQMGFSYHQALHMRAKGKYNQGPTPDTSATYDYHYNIYARQLMAENKFLLRFASPLHPYILLSLGTAINSASGYKTDAPDPATSTRIYENSTNAAFTYQAGIGVDMDINSSLRFGVGYHFSDFGKVRLGDASINGAAVPGTLSQRHLFAHEFTAQLTMLF